ncbi:unnamed protein product, partial [Amoebophrya sp. A120]
KDFVARHNVDGSLILRKSSGADETPHHSDVDDAPPPGDGRTTAVPLAEKWPEVWAMIKQNTARSILTYIRKEECIGGEHIDQRFLVEDGATAISARPLATSLPSPAGSTGSEGIGSATKSKPSTKASGADASHMNLDEDEAAFLDEEGEN